jgi:hypothetical protein
MPSPVGVANAVTVPRLAVTAGATQNLIPTYTVFPTSFLTGNNLCIPFNKGNGDQKSDHAHMSDAKANLIYFCAGCKKTGKGDMDKNGTKTCQNGPYDPKSFLNNRHVALFCLGNSAIFMPTTTTVPKSPILQAHHNTIQSDVTPF